MTRLLPPLLLLLLMGGCSSTPILPTEGVNTELSAQQVVDSGKEMSGNRVLWGGVIINTTNLKSNTRLEILTYPLNSNHRPITSQPAGSRFLAYQPGYLETVDYAAGRLVSLVGVVSRTEEARLGEHRYKYPSVNVEKLHLWPVKSQESDTRLHFGIGVMFRN